MAEGEEGPGVPGAGICDFAVSCRVGNRVFAVAHAVAVAMCARGRNRKRDFTHPTDYPLWIGSIQRTCSGFSTGSMSRLTTTASLSLRTSTHSSGSSGLALISWCGT